MTRYRTIVADPPWEVDPAIRCGGRRARSTEVPYSFMSIDALGALPVESIAEDDAHLYLWATRKRFRDGVAATLARAWGFEPCGEVIWGLRNPGMGKPPNVNDHEPVLVARRGSLPFLQRAPMGVYFWRQRYLGKHGKEHSAKPDGFLDFVEANSPGPRVELFARRERFGWDTWGDQSLGTAELPGAAA